MAEMWNAVLQTPWVDTKQDAGNGGTLEKHLMDSQTLSQVGSSAIPNVGSRRRLAMLAIFAGCLTLLGLAWILLPDSRGHGTHVQWGMPSCSYLARTGYPCPGCGMTTSLAAAVHGQILLATKAQFFGLLTTLALMCLCVASAVEAATGRRVVSRLRPRMWWLWAFVAAWLAGWGIKVWVGCLDGTYPLGR